MNFLRLCYCSFLFTFLIHISNPFPNTFPTECQHISNTFTSQFQGISTTFVTHFGHNSNAVATQLHHISSTIPTNVQPFQNLSRNIPTHFYNIALLFFFKRPHFWANNYFFQYLQHQVGMMDAHQR